MIKITWLIIELVLLFFGVPLFIYYFGFVLPPVGILLAVVGYIMYINWHQTASQREEFFSSSDYKTRNIRFVLKRFYTATLILMLLLFLYDSDLLFVWLIQKPTLWLAVIILYPLLSVVPQEFVYRGFFFVRYKKIFRRKKSMILASAVCFGFAHIMFHNLLAVMMSFIGGIFFASSYSKTQSLKLAVFEHTLYGVMIFTLGLGDFFYHGAVYSLE